jgi:hypothetical protein
MPGEPRIVEVAKSIEPALVVILAIAAAIMVSAMYLVLREIRAIPIWVTVVVLVTTVHALGLIVLPQFFLTYYVTSDAVRVRTIASRVHIARTDIVSVTPIEYRLKLRIFGTSTIAYNVGIFDAGHLGRVRAYVGRGSGEGVLLVLRNGERVILSPRDPQRLILYLQGGSEGGNEVSGVEKAK